MGLPTHPFVREKSAASFPPLLPPCVYTGPLRGTGVWKLPTGLLDCGEDLGTGAEREVQEETGIRTRWVPGIHWQSITLR